MNTDPEELASILAPVRHVLLDFDGPVCSVFAGFPAADVARRLADLLAGPDGLPPGHGLMDPLAMLRHIADVRPDLVPMADDALARLEVEAVAQARPTEGSVEFLEACAASDRQVWLVSNNATAAMDRYIETYQLKALVAGCFGRVPGRPKSMKPSPELLLAAMRVAHAEPAECIFIGDAIRDVQAAKAAGVLTIGYANKPGKAEALAEAGAVSIVTLMKTLAESWPA
ncbi:HAD family hydrolase [Actinacidiphila acidipaludis]|uniref:HAD-IA family hydrolase n=1 Tax=Actinacidiphila acidipaludis TaxID=2873382 RepID=A0ABS7Q308_9ACTN|nr:HAD-IA family hydrolase [Streptomyces acidipaludis]MBY8877524.1 HAD-IA family hydrolase [Streptomyces acidipaludis]